MLQSVSAALFNQYFVSKRIFLTGLCMENLNCKGMDTRDSYGRDRFLPVSLETHLTLGIVEDTWLWEMHPSFYPVQKVCVLNLIHHLVNASKYELF